MRVGLSSKVGSNFGKQSIISGGGGIAPPSEPEPASPVLKTGMRRISRFNSATAPALNTRRYYLPIGPDLRSGVLSDAVDFDGTYYFTAPYNAAFDFAEDDEFSIACWVYLDVLGNYYFLNHTNNYLGYGLFSYSSQARFMFWGGTSSIYRIRYIGGGISAGSWIHLVGTKGTGAFSTSTLNVYVNGSSTGQGWYSSGTMAAQQHSGPLNLGNFGSISTYKFADGAIDEAAIWDKELSPTDVSNLYNSGSGALANTVEPGNLVAYYKCDAFGPYTHSGSGLYGKSLPDASGNGHTMVSSAF